MRPTALPYRPYNRIYKIPHVTEMNTVKNVCNVLPRQGLPLLRGVRHCLQLIKRGETAEGYHMAGRLAFPIQRYTWLCGRARIVLRSEWLRRYGKSSGQRQALANSRVQTGPYDVDAEILESIERKGDRKEQRTGSNIQKKGEESKTSPDLVGRQSGGARISSCRADNKTMIGDPNGQSRGSSEWAEGSKPLPAKARYGENVWVNKRQSGESSSSRSHGNDRPRRSNGGGGYRRSGREWQPRNGWKIPGPRAFPAKDRGDTQSEGKPRDEWKRLDLRESRFEKQDDAPPASTLASASASQFEPKPRYTKDRPAHISGPPHPVTAKPFRQTTLDPQREYRQQDNNNNNNNNDAVHRSQPQVPAWIKPRARFENSATSTSRPPKEVRDYDRRRPRSSTSRETAGFKRPALTKRTGNSGSDRKLEPEIKWASQRPQWPRPEQEDLTKCVSSGRGSPRRQDPENKKGRASSTDVWGDHSLSPLLPRLRRGKGAKMGGSLMSPEDFKKELTSSLRSKGRK